VVSPPTENQRFVRPEIALTVDAVVFTKRAEKPMLVLVQRGNEPFLGRWALPGGFVETDEDLPDAASRELREETGLNVPPAALTQLGAYGRPGRDPRMRVVSIVFWAYRVDLDDPIGGSDAASSKLIAVDDALSDDRALAFDHDQILREAVDKARQQGWPVSIA
jgi:8-oxo-dGTP diphosphatase